MSTLIIQATDLDEVVCKMIAKRINRAKHSKRLDAKYEHLVKAQVLAELVTQLDTPTAQEICDEVEHELKKIGKPLNITELVMLGSGA